LKKRVVAGTWDVPLFCGKKDPRASSQGHCVMEDGLKADRLRIKATLRSLARQVRNEQKKNTRREQRLRNRGRCGALRLAVLAVFARGHRNEQLAANFWAFERQVRGTQGEEATASDGVLIVRDWVAAATPHDWERVARPVDAAAMLACRSADRFLHDAATAQWACSLNVSKGHAPSTQELRTERLHHGSHGLPSSSCLDEPASSATAARSWGHRWRRRWFLKYGKLQIRDKLDVADIRHKVLVRQKLSPKVRHVVKYEVP
jgi:hypothetical protein